MPDDLRAWQVYVNGDDRCTCRHEWKALGRLDGVSMGDGWVRITTEPDCPHHGAPTRAPRSELLADPGGGAGGGD